MTPFAFVIHPLVPRDAAQKYPFLRYLPDGWIERLLATKQPGVVSEIKGLQSATGATAPGWFIGCPMTPRMMTQTLALEDVYERITECTRIAQREGAKIIGLGAFTSVVGDGGITVASRAPIAVTTGNSYTVATAIEGIQQAAGLLGIDPASSTLAVVGATGSIGKTCARILGADYREVILVGRDLARTEALAAEMPGAMASTDPRDIKRADVIVTVTSTDSAVIQPEHLRPGALVCDVARPRDVSVRVSRERPDVLVIEGGVVHVPGDVDFGLSFGFPPQTAYACMSETMMLALEGRAENFTLGKDVTEAQVRETWRLAERHGFRLAGFRSFERAVDSAAIDRARSARAKFVAA